MKKTVLLVLLSILVATGFASTLYLPIVVNAGHVTPTPPPATNPPPPTPSTPPPPGVYTYTAESAMDVNLYNRADAIWLNNGKHSAIQFGNYNYALIKFDLSSLPTNAIVRKATLQLGLYEGGGNADIWALVAANAGWIEGVGDFDKALAGEPCWAALASNGNNGVRTAWVGGSNGAGVVGVDIGSSPIGTLTANQQPAGVYNVTLNIAAVQGWVHNRSTNAGILIKPTVFNSNHIALREYKDTRYIPRLVVEYDISTSGKTSNEGIQPRPELGDLPWTMLSMPE